MIVSSAFILFIHFAPTHFAYLIVTLIIIAKTLLFIKVFALVSGQSGSSCGILFSFSLRSCVFHTVAAQDMLTHPASLGCWILNLRREEYIYGTHYCLSVFSIELRVEVCTQRFANRY